MKVFSFKQNLLMFLLFLTLFTNIKAQEIEAKIKISGNKIQIEGTFLSETPYSKNKNWSFLENYADADKLSGRFSKFALEEALNKPISVKQFIQGEYEATKEAKFFRYEVDLPIPEKITSTAHVSWLTENHGLLMANDIFPQWQTAENQPISAKLTFEMPANRRIVSNESKIADKTFMVNDLTKSIFFVGQNFREKRVWVGKNELNLTILGEWKFSDEEALQIASDILQEHQRTFGESASAKSQIFLLPFPKSSYSENWRAETRGSTVTLISGMMPFKQPAIQRLHEQLRHELFHLWLPNNLALTGNYDWFYEGFTIYQSLRTGVQLNALRFDDYLETLSRTYDVANNFDNEKLSLLQASQNRWKGYTSLIYNKGVMVAFLCDMALLKASKGKRNISDVLRQIWKQHKIGNSLQDGNVAILKILKSYPELQEILSNHVEGNQKIVLENKVGEFGIEIEKINFGTQLKVLSKLNGRQKDLLDKLGYNQWRKILGKTE